MGKFKGFALYAARGFHIFRVLIGVGVYGNNLEEAIRKQPSSMRDVMFGKWIRVPLTSKMDKLTPIGAWGSEGGWGPNDTSMVSTDFVPWCQDSLESLLVSNEKERRGKRQRRSGTCAI